MLHDLLKRYGYRIVLAAGGGVARTASFAPYTVQRVVIYGANPPLDPWSQHHRGDRFG
ncbi:MAG: hypothetical protein HC808_15240 [Candidatus Competibacteraceae bacterium]|nr:hypothetical protein [Candidatus Competibacteraceae bacterium]